MKIKKNRKNMNNNLLSIKQIKYKFRKLFKKNNNFKKKLVKINQQENYYNINLVKI